MSLADELAKLEELRRSGALTEDEFARAKAAVLAGAPAGKAPAPSEPLAEHLAGQLAEARLQNELERIDREWEHERRQHVIPGRYGTEHVPTSGMGIGTAVIGGLFGALWTAMAVGITSGAPDFGPFAIAKVVFPLFGIVFVVGAIGYGIHIHSKAEKYQEAFAAYKARRERAASPEPAVPAARPRDDRITRG